MLYQGLTAPLVCSHPRVVDFTSRYCDEDLFSLTPTPKRRNLVANRVVDISASELPRMLVRLLYVVQRKTLGIVQKSEPS